MPGCSNPMNKFVKLCQCGKNDSKMPNTLLADIRYFLRSQLQR